MPVITNENVQIWTLYATVVIAIVGFIFNTISLWQTKKATEDIAKPYINVYVDAYAVESQQRVYAFKNFGQTPAYIKDIKIDGKLDKYNSKHNFRSLIGNMIAPGQKLTSSIHPDYKGSITLKITYTDSKRRLYTDSFKLNAGIASDMLYTVNESNKSDNPASAIRQSTMALLRDLR